jgi:hypothetical protein
MEVEQAKVKTKAEADKILQKVEPVRRTSSFHGDHNCLSEADGDSCCPLGNSFSPTRAQRLVRTPTSPFAYPSNSSHALSLPSAISRTLDLHLRQYGAVLPCSSRASIRDI